MDHKWGRNIVDLGLVAWGFTLASRIQTGPFVNWIATNDRQVGGAYFVRPLAGTHPRIEQAGPFFAPVSLNFPYGYDVEPDAPV